jgi:hypothetical protein
MKPSPRQLGKLIENAMGPWINKTQEQLGIPAAIFMSLLGAILSAVTLQSPWIPESTELITSL